MTRRLRVLCVGFIRLGEGLVMILTLGFYYPHWEMAFLVWEMGLRARRRKDD